LLENL